MATKINPVGIVKFGPQMLMSPTPNWAKMVLKITICVTSVALFILAGTSRIPNADVVEYSLWLKGVDMLVLLLSQMFGIDVTPEANDFFSHKSKNV